MVEKENFDIERREETTSTRKCGRFGTNGGILQHFFAKGQNTNSKALWDPDPIFQIVGKK
jgi:hypothetical protein